MLQEPDRTTMIERSTETGWKPKIVPKKEIARLAADNVRNETAFLLIPTGNFPYGAHAKHERLFRQRNGRRPGQAKRSEIRHCRYRTACRVSGQTALACERHQFVVALEQFP